MARGTDRELISVVIPTYNRASFLAAALDSVSDQECRPIEIIVLDDGSTDDTCRLVHTWTQRHATEELCVLYRRQPNRGAASARNAGMALASGAFLHFLDSDCTVSADFFHRLIRKLQGHPSAPYAYGTTRFVDETGAVIQEVGREPEPDPHDDAVAQNMTCIAPLFRRQALDDISWNEALVCLQDWAFKAVVTIREGTGVFVRDAAAVAVLHAGDRISKHGTSDFLAGQARTIRFVCSCLPQDPATSQAKATLGRRMMSVAKGYMRLGDLPAARQAIREAAGLSAGHPGLAGTVSALTRLLGIRSLTWAMRITGRL